MITSKTILSLLAATSLAIGSAAFAADKTYQVTGPVLELNDKMIAVQKGKDRWEIARTADTKVTGDLKVGAKVTIEYTMTATTVEAKADKPAKADKKAAAAPAATAKP
jgi:hypothetical protein